ncbi:MAG: phosphoribosyl-AMP cyclohydrolase [Aestuariivita sp.]|nr:phosphoribosyl-AMP cyclohydrolase [Aestuariivita sp.]
MTFNAINLVYNDAGLIPVITQDNTTKEILMMAWMNSEAVSRTLSSGHATYWSRSRKAFWVKGEASGHTQKLIDFRVDCDRDCLLMLVEQTGPACHTNRQSCFYRSFISGDEIELMVPVAD